METAYWEISEYRVACPKCGEFHFSPGDCAGRIECEWCSAEFYVTTKEKEEASKLNSQVIKTTSKSDVIEEEWISDFSSTNVAGFGYNLKEKKLTVEFYGTKRNPENSIYDYYDVPKTIFDGMKDASSKGTYLTNHIKGVFRYDLRRT